MSHGRRDQLDHDIRRRRADSDAPGRWLMPYWLESDTFHDDPRWEVLAARRLTVVDQLQAAHCRLMSMASHQRHDGYLTAGQVLTGCRRQDVADKLCRPVLDLPPLLHRKGDDCPCLGGAWIEGFDFRVHGFLKRNPSRRENDRNKDQKADRRDARLRKLVYDRDGGCCRYCRSGPLNPQVRRARKEPTYRRRLLSMDHVDPDRAATPDGGNYVTACARCNEEKGHSTPEEAGMALLPEPTPGEIAEWAKRGEQLFDRPEPGSTDQTGTSTRADPNQPQTSDSTSGSTTGPDPGRTTDTSDKTTGDVCPDQPEQEPEPGAPWSEEGVGSGRGAAVIVKQPARSAADPDIYNGRSRGSTSSPGREPEPADVPEPDTFEQLYEWALEVLGRHPRPDWEWQPETVRNILTQARKPIYGARTLPAIAAAWLVFVADPRTLLHGFVYKTGDWWAEELAGSSRPT